MNKKRVRRLYRLDGLQLRMRVRRRKHIALHRGPAPVPAGPTERWSMDFVHDALADGRPFRVLTVVDQWSRQSPILEVASSPSGATVGLTLDRVLPTAPGLRSITVDHGTEFMSRALEDWAYQRGVQLDFIRPGKPVENAFIESFNGRLRDECLTCMLRSASTPLRMSIFRSDFGLEDGTDSVSLLDCRSNLQEFSNERERGCRLHLPTGRMRDAIRLRDL